MVQKPKKKKVGKYMVFLDQQLGRGTYSCVYKGMEMSTQQLVAVKVADKSSIYQECVLFINTNYEALTFQEHYQVFRCHETKHNYYIVQQLAEGTLRQLMKKVGRLPEKEALEMFSQLVNGFGELVKNGIIHRDVKPQNILIKDKILKIADFGFAKQSDNNSFMKTIVGSPLYMSPQLLKEQPYTYKCDIYALGVILHKMIVGAAPWKIISPDMIKNIQNKKIEFSSEVGVSKEVQQLIFNCLKWEEEDRQDWEKIYMHPLFREKFKQNFQGINDNSIKLAFLISGIRMTMHFKNIDVLKLIEKIPSQLKQHSINLVHSNLIACLNQSIPTSTLSKQILFHHILKQSQQTKLLKKEHLKQFFKSIGVRIKAINLSEIQNSANLQTAHLETSNKAFLMMARLKQKIQSLNIDIFQLYRNQDKAKSNTLQPKELSMLLLAEQQIKLLFEEIDLNKDGKISFNQLIKEYVKQLEL